MNINHLIRLVLNASKGINNIDEGAIGFSNYGFLFRQVSLIADRFGLEYTSGLSPVGSRRELIEDWDNDNIQKKVTYLCYRSNKVKDLHYAGALKTLLPSVEFGGNDKFFEVGMLIKTPNSKIFPATFYWGSKGLAIGGWKQEIFSHFVMLEKSNTYINFAPLELTDDKLDGLIETIQHTLQTVHVSDFEGDYWTEFGGTTMGIRSGKPFIMEIPIDNDPSFAIVHYKGEFWEILHSSINSKDKIIFKERMSNMTEVNPEKSSKLVNEFNKYLIEKCYNLLIDHVHKKCSRFAFQAIGHFLIENGGKITSDLKKSILENSRWRDERYRFKDITSKIERKKFLYNFRAEILCY